MILEIKKIDSEAKIPSYAHAGDAGMDLFALENVVVPAGKVEKIRTGISVAIPDGFVGLLWDKSGLSINNGIKLLGGVIDSGYRGELFVGLINLGDKDYIFEKHNKIAQLIVQSFISPEIQEVDVLSDTSRGNSGFGSTGK